ncbi:MAG: adenosine kinase [Bacteroidales bacterium]|jgi:sugar/nucleoside kinase (ribokinase family)|nr:adenosine kinase [Bacteroidales bacterium]
MKKVLGLGNALVDIVTLLENDTLLNRFNLPKGSMTLVDKTYAQEISDTTDKLTKEIASGGSAANTINGLASLGVDVCFLGKVGNDELGALFAEDMAKNNIHPRLFLGSEPTGRATALISKDSERTFATYLGSAIELTADDLSEEDFEGYHFFHVEGYLVQNNELIEQSMKIAKSKGLTVSLDLASYNVVEDNYDFLHRLVENYVDIVFANEEEAKAFTGEHPEEALNIIAEKSDIAVVKTGSKGSLVKCNGNVVTIDPIKVNSIDTTGAGDMYAAGFLYGLTKGLPLNKCGDIGSLLAGNVIEVLGPKLNKPKWAELKDIVCKIENN